MAAAERDGSVALPPISSVGRLAVVVVVCWLGGCCGSAASTMPCGDPSDGDGGIGVSLATPALECPSKLCLITRRASGLTALCTTECASDGDCAALAGAYCKSGYACAPVGAYPRPVCVCR
jgi:hypothetical protein